MYIVLNLIVCGHFWLSHTTGNPLFRSLYIPTHNLKFFYSISNYFHPLSYYMLNFIDT